MSELAPLLEPMMGSATRVLADALNNAAYWDTPLTLEEYARVSADVLSDFYEARISPSAHDLAVCILDSLICNGYDDDDVPEMEEVGRFGFLDIADYALQLADAEGVTVSAE